VYRSTVYCLEEQRNSPQAQMVLCDEGFPDVIQYLYIPCLPVTRKKGPKMFIFFFIYFSSSSSWT